MTIGALIRPTMNCSRAVLWSWLGARTTRSKEPLRRSAIRSGFFLGLASGHSGRQDRAHRQTDRSVRQALTLNVAEQSVTPGGISGQ